jgi:transposase
MMYVGLDVHKRFCHGTMMSEDGAIVKQERFSNDPRSLDAFLGGVDGARVVMEAGYCWQPLYDRLEMKGHDVRLAHPLKTKAIAQAKVKTDKVDARILAHLLRADLVPEAWVPPKEIRELRELVKRRAFLVRLRTKVKNRVHAELAKRAIPPVKHPFTRKGREVLQGLGIDAVSQLLPVLAVLDRQIGEVSAVIDRTAVGNRDAMLLTTMPGVGFYIALLLVAEIGDVHRFPDAERLCAGMGLVPSVRQSGSRTIYGPITKEGSRWVRWALTQAVHVHVRYDTRLSRFYRRLAHKKGTQVATVATARKMLTVVYWMLREQEPYRP